MREPNEALRRARQEHGWSQSFLATQLDTSAKNVSRWERGTTRPSPYFQTKLCQIFGTDTQALGLLDPPVSPISKRSESTSAGLRDMPRSPIFDPALISRPFSTELIVGRDALLERVLTALNPGHTCALHGLPGVGKTTLAQMAARHEMIQKHFPDGVLWVGLGPSTDPVSTFTRWATLLGVSEDILLRASTVDELRTFVQQALATRQVLLIIDDAWTSDDALRFLVGGPGCAHLLTTRFPQIALLVTDEPPILVPELDEPETSHLLTRLVPMLATGEAAQLQHLFRITGGLPLAVTLLGKYLRLHAYNQQPRRLQAALASLSETHTRLQLTLPASTIKREGDTLWSLQTIIALSDEHLSPQAQEALRAISVLPAKPERFSEEAALAVCQYEASVLDQLCDAGLLESAGSGWYCLHQTIADYARIQLSDQKPSEQLLHYAIEKCSNPNNLTSLAQEHATLLAALHGTAIQSKALDRITLVHYLTNFWCFQGHTILAEHEVRQTLALAQTLQENAGSVQLLCDLARCLLLRGDTRTSEEILLKAQNLAHQVNDPALLSMSTNALGNYYYLQGNLEVAEQCYRESLQLARQQGDIGRIGKSLSNLGSITASRGKWSEARHYWAERLDQARSTQSLETMCLMLRNLGRIAIYQLGGEAEAQIYLQEALALAEHLTLHIMCADTLQELSELAYVQGQLDQAETYNQEGLKIARQFRYSKSLVLLLDQAASLAMAGGHVKQASDILEEAEQWMQENAFLRGIVHTRKGKILLIQHRIREAEILLEDALAVFDVDEVEFRADAEYALAQVQAEQGRNDEAKLLAERSLSRYRLMEHRRASSIQAWLLARFPAPLYVSPHVAHGEEIKRDNGEAGQAEQEMPPCPYCHSQELVQKRGKSRTGAQRYHCKRCQRDFTISLQRIRPSSAPLQQIQAQALYTQGMSLRAIAREVGVHHETVRRWLTPPTKILRQNRETSGSS